MGKPIYYQRPSLGERAVYAVGRGLRRLIAWAVKLVARLGWRHRKLLAPVYVALWLAIYVEVARLGLIPDTAIPHVRDDLAYLLMTGAAGAIALAGWLRYRRWKRGKKISRKRFAFAWSCLVVATAWASGMLLVDLSWRDRALAHAILTTTIASLWIWDRRVRVTPARFTEQQRIWDEHLGAPGKVLAGTRLTNVKDGSGNVVWEGVITGVPGQFTPSKATNQSDEIASAYEGSAAEYLVDVSPDGKMNKAVILRVAENKTYAIPEYDETWRCDFRKGGNGAVPIAVYPDGKRGSIAMFVPRNGAKHGLFSGDSGNGKSKTATLALHQYGFTGIAVPWFGCPQGGQSSPAYAGPDGIADRIGRGNDEDQRANRHLVLELYRIMHSRSQRLAKMLYRVMGPDGKLSKPRRGLDRWDPHVWVDQFDSGRWVPLWQVMPQIVAMVDEWPMIVRIYKDLVPVVASIVKMSSKTGIKLDLAAQMPNMGELGDDDTIRQQLRANVIALRNSEAVAKGMILPPEMPSPQSIPLHPPGRPDENTFGTLILYSLAPGSARPMHARAPYNEDDFEMAEEAHRFWPQLPREDAEAAGPDYLRQWEKNPGGPKPVDADWIDEQERARQAKLQAERDALWQAERERIEAGGDAPAVTDSAPAGVEGGTIADRAVRYLERLLATEGCDSATNREIATALGITEQTCSKSLKREADKPDARLYQLEERGEWRLAPTRALAEAAA